MINLSLMSIPTPSRFSIISPETKRSVLQSTDGRVALARNEGLKLPYAAVDITCCHKQVYEA